MAEVVEGVVLARAEEGALPPDFVVAGVPLALRSILTLQGRGIERVVLLVRDEHRALAESLAADGRVRAQVEIVTEPSAVMAALTGPLLVARYDRVIDPARYRPYRLDEAAPLIASGDVTVEGDGWAYDVSDAAGRRAATRALFEACRKPVDGVVSRHLNRHVSLFLSRLLVNTPVTPNAMTVVTFSVSVLAAWFALDGSYTHTAIAAVLMQLNSILDGCDGELARVRFQGSKLGQWLDTVGDDASNVLFWAALGFGARSVADYGAWLAIAGWVAAAANGIAALENYLLLARKGSGDFYALQEHDRPPPSGVAGSVVALFNVVLKQDFFLFLCMCIALAGYLHHALPIVALGAIITLGASTARLLRANSGERQPNSK